MRRLEPPGHLAERGAEIGQPRELGRKRLGGNDDVDVLQQFFCAGAQLLDVDDRAHAGLSRRARGNGRRERFVIVDEQHTSAPDRADRNVCGGHREARIAVPDHRPVAAAHVDEHQRGVARGTANPADERRIHIVALEALDADARGIVIAERADVLRLPAEPRAADRGARALSSRQRGQALDARLATRHRVVRDHRDDVEAVEAEGDDVEWTVGRKGRQQRQAHQLTFAFPLRIVRACCH